MIEGHCCIIGGTGSGKTFHGDALVRAHVDKGIPVIISNMARQKFIEHKLVKTYSTEEGFFEAVENYDLSVKCLMYIDEAPMLAAHKINQTKLDVLLQSARHKGWVILSTQRPIKSITPTVRSQCHTFRIFNINLKEDIKYVAKMLGIENKVIENIPKYHYLDYNVTKNNNKGE